MRGNFLEGLHAGYVAWEPERTLPELKYAGEEWAFREYATTFHAHPFHELHLQLSGSTEWETAEGPLTVEAGMLIGMAPGVRHRMRPLTPRPHHFIYCSVDLAEVLGKHGLPTDLPLFSQPAFLIPNAGDLIAPFTTLSQEIRHQRPCRETLLRLTLQTLTVMLYRLASTAASSPETAPAPEQPLKSRFVALLKDHIDRHLNEKLSIPHLSSQLGISRSALFEITRRELGKSPAAYQMERRMEAACTMMATPTLSLTQIAYELGFSSSQHFSGAFRKHYGLSPSHYRARYRDVAQP